VVGLFRDITDTTGKPMHIPAYSNPKRILAIDPGPRASGYVVYHEEGMDVKEYSHEIKNEELIADMSRHRQSLDLLVIEMVGYYGMAVGRDIFETVRWIGIFQHAFGMENTILHFRKDVKLSLCNNYNASTSNLRTAILGRFPPTGGGATPAIGIKKQPGRLYGIKSHSMSAISLAITWRDNFIPEYPWTRTK